jgi:ubiquinone/menaquinone biosynthesis C-methylase UbiE
MVQRFLGRARVYDMFQRALGSHESDRRFVAEHVRPGPDDRVLDLACGTARILAALPSDVRYVGLDISTEYIDAARRRWGSRGAFHAVDVREATVPPGSFERVLMMGVLHHLDDESCRIVLGVAAQALTSGGHLIAIDGEYREQQGRVAHWLLRSDRGGYVRRADEYAALAASLFRSVSVTTRSDLLRLPYPHVVLECSP